MLKFRTIATISLITLTSIISQPVQAQTENITAQNVANEISPQKLLKLARQGRFKAQGIPSYSGLNSSIKSGEVTAKKLVSAAIKENRLPETALEDANYLTAINNHLKSGGCGSL